MTTRDVAVSKSQGMIKLLYQVQRVVLTAILKKTKKSQRKVQLVFILKKQLNFEHDTSVVGVCTYVLYMEKPKCFHTSGLKCNGTLCPSPLVAPTTSALPDEPVHISGAQRMMGTQGLTTNLHQMCLRSVQAVELIRFHSSQCVYFQAISPATTNRLI